MLKVAITGNIAAGKSSVGEILKQQGYIVLDTDILAHDLVDCDPSIVRLLKEIFDGYDIFCDEKNLSRQKIGQIVFKDKKLRKKLEDLLHPLIKNKLKELFNTHSNEKIIFVLVPLLFETGYEEAFDKIILVKADDELRFKRLVNRNAFTEEHAKARMDSQLPQNQKVDKSDFVIENNSDLTALNKAISNIIDKLLAAKTV